MGAHQGIALRIETMQKGSALGDSNISILGPRPRGIFPPQISIILGVDPFYGCHTLLK